MNTTSPPRSRFRWLLLGCLGLPFALFLLLAVAVVAARPWRPAPVLERAHQVSEHPLPSPSTPAPHPAPPQLEPGGTPSLEPGATAFDRPGRIVLDVRLATLMISPGPPGSTLRLESESDADHFRLREELSEQGDGWTYRLGYGPKTGLLGMLGSRWVEGNRLHLVVPEGVPVTLEGRVGIGESRLELGGLDLSSVDLRFGVGEHEVRFSSPTRRPVGHLRVDAAVGELRLIEIGNASPLTVQISQRIGDLRLDLEGDWRSDAAVRVHLGIGDSRIALPEGVEVLVEGARVGIGTHRIADRSVGGGRLPGPRLHLRASGRVGELRIE